MENVKGLLNHEKGETFSIILKTLWELGYDVQWMVLNSKFFGVPQNRERVFIIGSLRGTSRPEILPFREITKKNYGVEREIMYFQNSGREMKRIYNPNGVAPTIHLKTGGWQEPKIVASRGRNPKNPSDRTTGSPTEQRLELNKEGTTNTLSSVQKDNLVMNTIQEAVGTRAGSSTSYKKSINNIKETIGEIRRLTPTECERLQGFPDGWTKGVSDTQRYKQMGNAVTVNVIRAIAERLMQTNRGST